MFVLMELIDILVHVAQVSSQVFHDGLLVVPGSKAVLWDMRFILALSNSSVLAQHTITLRTFMLGRFLNVFVVGCQDTHPSLLLVGHCCQIQSSHPSGP